MASLITDKNGHRRIGFKGLDGTSKTIRLGDVDRKHAEAFKLRVEALVASGIMGTPIPAELAAWLRDLSETMYERLVRVGLVESRSTTQSTLGQLLDRYFGLLTVKPGTRTTMLQTRAALEEHFRTDRLLSTITSLDGEAWRAAMKEDGLAEATISKRIKTARSIFKSALRWGMMTGDNPLASVRAGSQTNLSRMHFVSREDFAKVLEACPNAQWRAVAVLSRFGGLRCPSEVLALRLQDVLWREQRLMVPEPKNEGREGRGVRPVPLFPEVQRALLECHEEAPDGAEYVIYGELRHHPNLGIAFARIIRSAGLKPWPKPFHSMRSSRQTELSERYPAATVAAWMGNTLAVAQAHYLQVRDEHFKHAAREEEPKATRNPTRHEAESGGTERKQHERPDAQALVGAGVCSTTPFGAEMTNDPDGIRTRVTSLKGTCPRPG